MASGLASGSPDYFEVLVPIPERTLVESGLNDNISLLNLMYNRSNQLSLALPPAPECSR